MQGNGKARKARKERGWQVKTKLPRLLRQAFRAGDSGDPWGRVMAWSYAVADLLTFKQGQARAGFRPSPLGPYTSAPEYRVLRRGRWSTQTLKHFERCLRRLEEIHRAAGRDY